MVQVCGRPCSATRLGYPLVDHGGAGRPLQLHAVPGDKHPHFHKSITGRQLGTYGGRDQGGGKISTEKPIWGAVGDESRAPERVARGVKEEEERGGRVRGRDDRQRGGGIDVAQLGEVSSPGPDNIQGGKTGGGGHVTGGGPDT